MQNTKMLIFFQLTGFIAGMILGYLVFSGSSDSCAVIDVDGRKVQCDINKLSTECLSIVLAKLNK